MVLLDKISNLDEDDQVEAIQQKMAEENEAIELCRALIKKEPWKKVASILQNLKADPESVRYSVLGYARSVLLRETNQEKAYGAYHVITCFADNFYDSKQAGLVMASYEAITK
jgi:hypothetical protein